VRLGGVPRRQRQLRHRADRRQRLAAEPEGADVEEIVVVEFGGGVALHRQHQVVAAHAAAVVGHRDAPPTAALGDHVDAGGTGVESVLHQLLHDAGGTLDDLAGGDAVDDGLGELPDGHGRLAVRGSVHFKAEWSAERNGRPPLQTLRHGHILDVSRTAAPIEACRRLDPVLGL